MSSAQSDLRSVHLFATPLAIVVVAIAFEYSGLDLAVTGRFFDPATGSWPYRDSFLLGSLLHDRAADLNAFLYAMILIAFLLSLVVRRLGHWRRPLSYLAVATVAGPVAVAVLKSHTHVYIPWDLTLFGGDLPYLRLFDPVPAGAPVGHGFPGGHSSGGFAWLSVFFLLRARARSPQWPALAAALAVGFLFSATQVVRGAHFPSHDLVSLAICWTSGLVLINVFYPENTDSLRQRTPRRLRRVMKNFIIN